jgi:UDP-glucose 4-epimerase
MTGVLITGASGFIGRYLAEFLADRGTFVRAAVRRPQPAFAAGGIEQIVVADISNARWQSHLTGVDTVVHCAGLAHQSRSLPESEYFRVNVEATAALARQARTAGVRLVFLSSVLAQCGLTSEHPLTEAAPAQPTSAYGRSKLAAEEAIRAEGVDFVIFRPAVVYGDGVKGNLATLARFARLPIPLPFASLTGRRSLLGLPNLADAVAMAIAGRGLLGQTYLVADPDPLTIGEIIAAMRAGIGRRAGLVPLPPSLCRALLQMAGQADIWARLGLPLVVDPARLLATGWLPRLETRHGLAELMRPQAD